MCYPLDETDNMIFYRLDFKNIDTHNIKGYIDFN